jgi:hypothetical protein
MHSVSPPWGASVLTCSPQNGQRPFSDRVVETVGTERFCPNGSGRSDIAIEPYMARRTCVRWNSLLKVLGQVVSITRGHGSRRAAVDVPSRGRSAEAPLGPSSNSYRKRGADTAVVTRKRNYAGIR